MWHLLSLCCLLNIYYALHSSSNSVFQFFPYSCLHSELVSCVGWTNPEEVYSAGDDHQILRWNLLTNESSLLVKLNDDVYPTDMQWFPKAGASKKGSASDIFALSSTDG